MFQPCSGIASLTVSATSGAGGDIFQNILHFRKNDLSAWSIADVTSLANSFDTWMGTTPGTHALLTYLSDAVSITGIQARDLTADGGPEFTKSVSHAGLDTAAPINSGLSFALTLRSGLSGRSFRGRIFCYGLTRTLNGSLSADQVDPTVANALKDGWNDLIAVADGWTPAMHWCVLSRRHKVGDVPNVLRTNGVGTPITEVGYSNLVVDFQRRRAPLHARHH